jgi:hypothetical protein
MGALTSSCLLRGPFVVEAESCVERATSESPYAESLAEGKHAFLRTKAFFGK